MPLPAGGFAAAWGATIKGISLLVAARSAVSAATTAALALLRFADLEGTSLIVLAVERLGGAGGISSRHLDKTETTRATGVPIVDQRDLFNGSMG